MSSRKIIKKFDKFLLRKVYNDCAYKYADNDLFIAVALGFIAVLCLYFAWQIWCSDLAANYKVVGIVMIMVANFFCSGLAILTLQDYLRYFRLTRRDRIRVAGWLRNDQEYKTSLLIHLLEDLGLDALIKQRLSIKAQSENADARASENAEEKLPPDPPVRSKNILSKKEYDPEIEDRVKRLEYD